MSLFFVVLKEDRSIRLVPMNRSCADRTELYTGAQDDQ